MSDCFFSCWRSGIAVAMLLMLLGPAGPAGAEELSFTSDRDTDIPIEFFPAQGKFHLLWLPSEAGPQDIDVDILTALAQQGVSSWRVDLVGAHFLPMVASSMDQLPAADVADLLDYARRVTGKTVFLVTTGRGAIPFLRGVHAWQRRTGEQKGFGGVILLSPKFFVETPDPGAESQLMPIVSHSNLPVYVLQAKQSPWFWKLDVTIPALKQSGSDVILQVMPGVRDRFYFRPEISAPEQAMTAELPRMLQDAMQALLALPAKTRVPPPLLEPEPAVRTSKKERVLKSYKGDPQAPALALSLLRGGAMDLADLKGKVVLVNYWASWCPPCVKEMPSMERLQQQLSGQAFTILAVNMAEDRATIKAFLKTKVSVTFPILLDLDGAALKRWGVFAFPTSFVLDKQGRIRYALFGAYEWDQQDAIDKIKALLAEEYLPSE